MNTQHERDTGNVRAAVESEAIRGWRLADLVGFWLEISCCKGQVTYPVTLMLKTHGDQQLADAVRKLRCKECKGPPTEVWLTETHNREHCHGAPPGWSVRLL